MLEELIRDRNALKVLDTVSDGVIITDLDRKIVFINETARRLLRYTEGEVADARCKQITHGSECEYSCPMTKAMQLGQDISGVPMWYRTKDGQLLNCRTSVTLLWDDAGKVVGGVEVFNDITHIVQLQEHAEERFSFSSIIGHNKAMQEVFDLIKMVAETDSTVLITGESGTGKEMVANAIHFNSLRRNRAFVKVNCAALNEGVLESELFGHVRGAFTGAIADKMGRFELAHGGTIFLDEIAEIPPATQVKLLRVLQEGELERVGSSKSTKVDVRVIAATNRDLAVALEDGSFRQDLYYRLNVFRINLPPLRDRREDDIPLLVDHFIKKIACQDARQEYGAHRGGGPGPPHGLPVPGQHPGAGEPGGARGHPVPGRHHPHAGPAPAPRPPSRRPPCLSSRSTRPSRPWSGTSSSRPWTPTSGRSTGRRSAWASAG